MAWIKMAESVMSLKTKADGTKPLDVAFEQLRTDHTVTFHMLPLPGKSFDYPKRQLQQHGASTTDPPFKKQKGKGKGKGKGKSKPSNPSGMPSGFTDPALKSNLADGTRICWNYNLPKQRIANRSIHLLNFDEFCRITAHCQPVHQSFEF